MAVTGSFVPSSLNTDTKTDLSIVWIHSSKGCICRPLPSEYGTHKTVKARFWPWPSGKSPSDLLSCSLFAGKWLDLLNRVGPLLEGRPLASERGGDIFNHVKDFHTENGSSQGQNLALTGLFVLSWLGSGWTFSILWIHSSKVSIWRRASPSSPTLERALQASGVRFRTTALRTSRRVEVSCFVINHPLRRRPPRWKQPLCLRPIPSEEGKVRFRAKTEQL